MAYDSKEAKRTIIQFMNEHFGQGIGKNLLAVKMMGFKISDLAELSNHEMKLFLDYLFKNLIVKTRDQQQTKMLKMVLYADIFGKKQAMDYVAESEPEKSMNPLDYMKELFGKDLHGKVLMMAKKFFQEPNIEKKDELMQITFMKNLFSVLFGFDKDLEDLVNLNLLKFVKKGANANFFLPYVITYQKKKKQVIVKTVENFVLNLKVLDPEEFQIMLVLLEQYQQYMQSLSKRDIDDLLKKIDIGQNPDFTRHEDENKITKIYNILEKYLGEAETKRVIITEFQRLKIKKLDKTSENTRIKFIDDVMAHSAFKYYSSNKTLYIEGLLRHALDT